jgi:hypothetical protein
MWKGDKRIFISEGVGITDSLHGFVNSLSPERFGYKSDHEYRFTVKYVERHDAVSHEPFIQKTFNEATPNSLNHPLK